MPSRLIKFKEIEELYKAGVREINVNNRILSPGAKDLALERGIRIVYGSRDLKNDLTSSEIRNECKENIKECIVRILKQEYSDLEAKKIEEITAKVIKHLGNKIT